ncbi:phage tail tape measure protein [Sporolactobacillus terrae]|uniref:Phage tail tape measure protein domain-containing protein n=1 Tax=Sporolactobacillus terrae TaxID=269673 RepID=A0A5K7WX33_9BACL|nr:phage tail tape measure protein [Sporolactobacillus terrae]BBN99155.1 hypothetical protein St703_18600 [Sporolactobacillus terrae]
MAGSRIKGITIEIDGETVGLQNALRKVNSESRSLQGQLNDVNRLLKFNPGNATLLAQQQRILAAQVENTKNRLKQLKQAEAEVQHQFAEGKISQQQYEAFQREIVATEGKLEHFQGQLAEANAALKKNGSVARQVAKDYQESFDEAKRSLGNTFDGLKTAGKTVTAASAGIAAGLGVAVKKSADFGAEMSRVGAIAGANGKQFDQLKAAALDLGAKTSLSASEVAKGMEDLAALGFSTTDIIKAMPGVISAAEASGQDLATTSQVVASAINAFGLSASDANHVADVLAMSANKTAADVNDLGYAFKYAAPVAKGMGVSMEELAAATGEMTDAGMAGEQAGTTLRASLLALANPSKTAAAELKELGVHTKDSKGNFVGFPSIIAQFQKGLEGMTGAQKTAALAQVFGTESASGMLTVISNGPGKFNALTKSLQDSDGASAKAAQQMKDNLAGAFQELGGAIETMMITIGDKLTPFLQMIANFVQNLVNQFNALPQSVQGFIAVAAAVTAALGLIIGPILLLLGSLPQIAAGFAMLTGPVGAVIGIVALVVAAIVGLLAVIRNLWQTNEQFRNNVMTVWQGIQAIFQAVMPAITAIIKVAWFLIKSIIVSTLDAIKNVIQGAFGVIANIFKLFGSIFTGNWKGAWDAIKGLLQSAVQLIWGIVNLYFLGKLLAPLKAFGPAAKGILQAIWNFIKGLFSGGVGAIRGFVEGGFNAIRSIISGVMKAIWSVIKTIWNTIRGNVSGTVSAIRSFVTGAWNGIKTAVSGAMKGVWNAIKSGWDRAVNFLKRIDLLSVGKNIIRGLINGIGSMMGAITDKIRSIASSITGGLKHALGIHSPSRVLRDEVGKMVGAGLQVGMLDSLRGIGMAAQKMSQAAIPTVPPVPDVPQTNPQPASGQLAPAGQAGTNGQGAALSNGLTLIIKTFINQRPEDIKQLAHEFAFYAQQELGGGLSG